MKYLVLALIYSFLAQAQTYQASQQALPDSFEAALLSSLKQYEFSVVDSATSTDLFEELKVDPNARMNNPQGLCATRRAYIQETLLTKGIKSGQLYIKCNKKSGVLRLQDRVSMEYYTYITYHDVNIIAVQMEKDIELQVLDLQFEDRPVSLSEYLGEVEVNQPLLPARGISRRNNNSRDFCYWSVNSPGLSSNNISI
jgi:hypothetical protein